MKASVDGPPALAPAAEPTVSPVGCGADALAAVQQRVLDTVSSPLTRVMYAGPLNDLRLVDGAGRRRPASATAPW